jgi:hypothetical protein
MKKKKITQSTTTTKRVKKSTQKRKFTKEKKKTMKQKTNPLPSKLPPMVSVCVAPKLVQNLSIYSCLSEKKQKKFPLKNKKT